MDGASPPRRADPVACGVLLLVAGLVLWRFDPGMESFFEPKFALQSAGVALLMGLAAIRAFAGRPLWLLVTPTALALLACVGWAELSRAWASSAVLARRSLGDWWAGLLLFLLVQHAVWVAGRRGLHRAVLALTALTVLVAGWALADDFRGPAGVGFVRLEDWRGAIAASLGNTGHIADLCGFGLLLALSVYAFARSRAALVFALLACVVLAAAMVVCFSFHSDVALIAAALAVLAGAWPHRRLLARRWRRFALLGLLWAAMLGFYFTDAPGNPHRPGLLEQALGSARLAWGWGSRLVIWSNTLEMIRLHPWLGWGVGCFPHGYPQQASAWVLSHPDYVRLAGGFTNAAHNEILQTWAELGTVGLALWAVVFALHFQACGRLMRRRRRSERLAGVWLLGATAMWLLQAQMNFPLQTPVGRLTLLLLLGAAASLDARSALAIALPLRGWRLAVAALITVALVCYPVGAAVVRHEVQRRMRAPYEASTLWMAERSALVQRGAAPGALARHADSERAWAAVGGYQRVLSLDPDWTDARSGLLGMIVAMGADMRRGAHELPAEEADRLRGQGETLLRAAISHGYRTLEGLAVADVYQRLALAHELLGERDEARRLWLIHFERAPGAIGGPDFERWITEPEFRRLWVERLEER